MFINHLRIQHFRGFSNLTVRPNGHVVVMGEAGAGKSDLVESLARVLDSDASRGRITTELDFFNRDTAQPIQIEMTISDIGADLEQEFLDHLELWDTTDNHLLSESNHPDAVDDDRYVWVLRLAYRAKWHPEEERCEEWVFYLTGSDPESDLFPSVRRRGIEKLGFGLLRWSGGRILDFGARSAFRRLIDRAGGNDFPAAIAQYVQDVTNSAGQFTGSAQVNAALEDVVGPPTRPTGNFGDGLVTDIPVRTRRRLAEWASTLPRAVN